MNNEQVKNTNNFILTQFSLYTEVLSSCLAVLVLQRAQTKLKYTTTTTTVSRQQAVEDHVHAFVFI